MMKTCPKCGESSFLREVLYGLPEGPVDEEKYAIGACCLSENDPQTGCINCGGESDYIDHVQTPSSIVISI